MLAIEAGARLPGGTYALGEDRHAKLLSALGTEAPEDGSAHPLCAWVIAMGGCGISIGELFEAAGVPMEDGPMLGACDLELVKPMGVETTYTVDRHDRGGGREDRPQVRPLRRADRPARGLRPGRRTCRDLHALDDPPAAMKPGTELGPRIIESVSGLAMHDVAAVLDDPNPIHLSGEAAAAAGLGDRPVNQGPVNIGYILDMLRRRSASLRDIRVRLLANVFAGDRVDRGRSRRVRASGPRRPLFGSVRGVARHRRFRPRRRGHGRNRAPGGLTNRTIGW